MQSQVGLPHNTVEQFLDQILALGKISRADQRQLMSELLAQTALSDTERRKISCLFERLQTGRLRVVK